VAVSVTDAGIQTTDNIIKDLAVNTISLDKNEN